MKQESNLPKPQTVDEYIAQAASNVKEHLERIRIAIQQAAPEAEECIGYKMPAYKQKGIVVYFGGFSKHISLFPDPEAIEYFKDELTDYKTSKGTIQFTLDKDLPISLIKKIVKYRVKQNIDKAKVKQLKK